MKQPLMIIKNNSRLWYIIYAVVLTVFFLYVMFPSTALTKYIREQVEKRYPDINISFNKVNLSLLAGIKIRGLKISSRENPGIPVFISEKSSVRISIPGWLKGDPRYYFDSKIKGGEISGFVEEKNSVNKDRIDASIDIENVKLDGNVIIHPVISKRLEGILTGKIKFVGDLPDLLRGNAEISLDLADGRFKLVNPVLDINEIGFKKISLSCVLDNRRLSIKDLIMTGGPVNGSATGTVLLSNNLFSSRLGLTGEIEPSPSLFQDMPEAGKAINLIKNGMKDGKLKIEIYGTLEKPLYKLR